METIRTWFQKIALYLPFGSKNRKIRLSAKETDDREDKAWWGTFSIEEEQSRFFKIGNIVLCLDRYNEEWHFTSARNADFDPENPTPLNEQSVKTFAAHTSNEITLKPILPDRPLLSVLDRPFYIPAGETLKLYISCPLLIQVETNTPSILLDEITPVTLSDTWFGSSTLEGELCYAAEIYYSPRPEELPVDTLRVICPISIVNRAKETLLLREIRIPLPNLSVYCDANKTLWTEHLIVHQEGNGQPEALIVKGLPKTLKEGQMISLARSPIKPGFKGLFSPFIWR